MKTLFLFSLILLGACATKNSENFDATPDVAFTVTEGILHPESAVYSATHQAIFVSNIASGNPMETKRVGYISKISPQGKVLASKWVEKLKAPKGIAIVGNDLYVSDVNELVKIDITTAKIVKTWQVAGAQFLNDVVADKHGNVYVSDMNTNAIHVLTNNVIKDWSRTPALRGPNGLYTDNSEHIIVAQWGSEVDGKTWIAKNPGHIAALSLMKSNKEFSEETSITGHLDGIDSDKNGNLLVSDWINGDVWSVMKDGKADKRFNFGPGTADISVAKDLNLLLVPQMNQNKIIAIKL